MLAMNPRRLKGLVSALVAVAGLAAAPDGAFAAPDRTEDRLDPADARGIERCGTMQNLEKLLQADPTLRARMDAIEADLQRRIAEGLPLRTGASVIPVVVHVIYNTSAQNISDAQV